MQDPKCIWHLKGFCTKGLKGTKCKLENCVAHTVEENKEEE